jgi:hypothetical protein
MSKRFYVWHSLRVPVTQEYFMLVLKIDGNNFSWGRSGQNCFLIGTEEYKYAIIFSKLIQNSSSSHYA